MIADYTDAANRQHRYETQHVYGAYSDDRFENLSEAVTAFCLYELAYYLGQDEAGDAGHTGFEHALAEDGFDSDDVEDARAYCARHWSAPAQWIAVLADEAKSVKQRKARDDAKQAVIRFVQELWA